MSKIIITYKDWVKCNIQGLDINDKTKLISDYKIFVPSARFTPTYKLGIWDGYIRYFEQNGNTYISLLPEILSKINVEKYEGVEYIYPKDFIQVPTLNADVDNYYMSDIKWPKGHRLEGQPVILEDHQVRCVNAMLRQPRGLLQSSTSSGKTLMAASLCRKIKEFGKIVYIVPYKDLCFQTKEDLIGFGLDVGIVGAGLREFGHEITLCMRQTLNSMEKKKKNELLTKDEIKELQKDVVCMIFDETHMATGHQVKSIVEQTFSKVPLRYGITGTIPKDKSDYMCLRTAIGPKIDEQVEAKELQDKGFCSKCEIFCLRLEDERTFMSWQDEKEYLSNDKERLTFIANLISQIVKNQKNTLVLIDRIKTGEDLEKMLLSLNVDAIFLSGDVKSTKRFDEYEKVKTTDNKCIIAIDKIASTGLNIPRLFNLVFIDYGKSFTKVIQSIGRGLRKANDKDFVKIYDISSKTKYSKKHFNERIHYYDEAQYPFQILNIDKWK